MNTMITALMNREGGFTDHPADKGGPTKYGITLGTLSKYLARPVTRHDIEALSPETAKEIYYTRYYLLPRMDALPKEIQPIMLDMCAHHGPSQAIRLLQRVINLAGIHTVTEDGICGPQTQSAARGSFDAMGDYFINALVEERLTFFRQIVSRNPSQFVFLKGWENRAESFRV